MSSHLLVMWSGIYLSLVKWSRLSLHGHVIQVIPSWSCDPGYSSLFTWSGLFLLRQSRDPDYSSLFMWSVLFLLGHVIRIIPPWSRDPDYSSLVTWSGIFILSHVIQIIPPWSYDPDYSSLVTFYGLFLLSHVIRIILVMWSGLLHAGFWWQVILYSISCYYYPMTNWPIKGPIIYTDILHCTVYTVHNAAVYCTLQGVCV